MDEPFSNLDARVRVMARAFVKDIQRRLGITTILVTHDPADALTLADRIAVLRRGVVQQIGLPSEVYDKPFNIFVANFIGDINLIEGFIESNGPGVLFNGGDVKIPLSEKLLEALDERSSVVLGIRPEDIVLSREELQVGDGLVNVGRGVVEISEFAGGKFNVMVRMSGIELKVVSSSSFGIGDQVNVYFNMNKIKLFNKSTETLIYG